MINILFVIAVSKYGKIVGFYVGNEPQVAIADFNMPILINSGEENSWIYPNSDWKEQSLGKIDVDDFSVVEDLFLIDIKTIK